ncbi:hypothetical protein ALC62_00097 [Cyphomyrmex costatus]|uniref:THAP-type domain-containing protein n=1 Tax=Cyphomyrmex costatus TaxID=456900 RepID=A0A151K1S2_9HYME|nr:hypothetical protein ALC62_00097 [Cyphomyrmex costatus]
MESDVCRFVSPKRKAAIEECNITSELNDFYESMNTRIIATKLYDYIIFSLISDMVKRCSAPDCPINAGQKIYMPYFPKDSKYREIWKKRVNRGPNWSPGKTGVLCEFHFEEDQFEQMRVDGKKKLKSHAVPSKFVRKNQSITEHSYAISRQPFSDLTNSRNRPDKLKEDSTTIL